MTVYERIPLQPIQQTFGLTLSGVAYRFRILYLDTLEGGWIMDIQDADEKPLVCGIPLLPGQDLLEQYIHLQIPCSMFVLTPGDPLEPPTRDNLGIMSNLYIATTS